jgi:carotenoid cleavage dioxygenase-like enzyme
MHIVEAGQPERGAVARVQIPLRLRSAVHGTWVQADRL